MKRKKTFVIATRVTAEEADVGYQLATELNTTVADLLREDFRKRIEQRSHGQTPCRADKKKRLVST